MQFLNSLFADNRLLTLGAAVIAFLVFAVFILLFVRLLFGNRLRMSGGRGRQQRLGVVDAYDMDRQRQLVLVRRDNTEHLIMIGGPNDLLIESTILRVEEREGRNRSASIAREAPMQEPPRLPLSDVRSAPPFENEPEADSQAAAYAPPTVSPTPVPVPAPIPFPVPPPYATPQEEARAVPEAPTLAPPMPEPPARPKDPMRLPDLFARMRGGRTPPASATMPEPPLAPLRSAADERRGEDQASVVPGPPVDNAALLESEIARALAPSLRERTASAAPLPPAADQSGSDLPGSMPEQAAHAPQPAEPRVSPNATAAPPPPGPELQSAEIRKAAEPATEHFPPNMEAPLPPTEVLPEPVAPPVPRPSQGVQPSRPPLRPFRPFTPPPRREPVVTAPTSDGARPSEPGARPSRPPPPPFFSRMAQRKERVEPPAIPVPTAEPTPDAPALSVAQAPAPVAPSEAPVSEPVATAPETVSAPPSPDVPSPPSQSQQPLAPTPASSPPEPTDPFEEEMARLLGRTPGKEN